MGNKTSKVYETLKGLKLRVILESIIIGVGAGFVISLYRLILDYLDGYTKAAYGCQQNIYNSRHDSFSNNGIYCW